MTPRHFAWQAWHLVTSTFVSRGRRGTWRHPPSFCVAGVTLMALGWLWWRAWSPLVAGDAAALCVASVALGDMHLHFMWQARHLVTSTFVSRGRRGTWRHLPSFCGRRALMALGWLWWRAWSPLVAGEPCHFAWQAWHLVTCTFISCGRRRTW